MVSSTVTTTIAATSAAGLVLVAVALWHRKRRREERIPQKWRRIGTLTKLALYPLKSGTAVDLEKGDCTDVGLRTTSDHKMRLQDRVFAVIDADGNRRTARQDGDLVFIKVSQADGTSVTFQAPKMDDLTLSVPKVEKAKKITLMMWRDEQIPGLDCGDKAAQWIQKYLDKEGLRLVYYDVEALGGRDHTAPPLSVIRKIYPNFRPHDSGTYGDYASYLLINAASLADLKKRMDEGTLPNLSERWFRPNFVVSGVEAFAEDGWNFFRIGDAVFQVTKPCGRCIMTVVDPDTGKKTKDMEPLTTLRKYREITDPEQLKFESKTAPPMGVYVGLRRPGCVRTGDAVYVPDE